MKPLREFIADQERWYLRTLLAEKMGNIAEVARVAGYNRTQMYRKLVKLGMKDARQKLLSELRKVDL